MKKIIPLLSTAILLVGCKNDKTYTKEDVHNHKSTSTEKVETTKKIVLSPHTSAMAMIGDAHIHIDYSSPGVRGRIIFGGLVGYDNVWQAGAHMATWIETNKDLQIDDKILPAGKYGFFTIPSKGDWTIMINKNWNQHGKDDYDENDDVVRFNVTPSISDEITEHLKYEVNGINDTEGTISLSWEKLTIDFNFNVIN